MSSGSNFDNAVTELRIVSRAIGETIAAGDEDFLDQEGQLVLVSDRYFDGDIERTKAALAIAYQLELSALLKEAG